MPKRVTLGDNHVNHIAFVVDDSGSMAPHRSAVVKVFDGEIAYLAQHSKNIGQETRVTVFLFGEGTDPVVAAWDTDVMRLPSLAEAYSAADGETYLIDGAYGAIEKMKRLNQEYGDHAFLLYVITDGGENGTRPKHTAGQLRTLITDLPENWTLAALVPDKQGEFHAKQFGFPAQNIQVWNTQGSRAIEQVGDTIRKATTAYMEARATGSRSVKNLFNLNASNLTSSTVVSQLEELPATEFAILPVYQDSRADDFVNTLHEAGKWKTPFRLNSVYYKLTKPEKIQPQKHLCVSRRRDGKVFTGPKVRQLLNLPDYDVKVNPASSQEFDIYVQSGAPNRKLIGGTNVLVLR